MAMESASDEPSYVEGRTELASDLVATSIAYSTLKHTKTVTGLSLSPDGLFLAIGDSGGRVTLRAMKRNGRRVHFFDAGEDVRVGNMAWVVSSSPPTWALYIAASNGFINCVSFTDADNIELTAKLTAVRVAAFISHIAVNENGTNLAASYEGSVKVWSIPFEDGPALGPGEAGHLLDLPFFNTRNWNHLPVREHPRVIGVQFIANDTLCVGYFAKVVAYNILTGNEIWTISAPNSEKYSTNIASFCVSPSKELIVAANLHSGFDWYSISLRNWLSVTKVDDAYDTQNYILPVRFLTERTFAAGHNYGCVTIGTNGAERTVSLGKKRGLPSKALTATKLESKFVIASSCGHVVSVQMFEAERNPDHGPATAQAGPFPSLSRPQVPALVLPELPTPSAPVATNSPLERELQADREDDDIDLLMRTPTAGAATELSSVLDTPTPNFSHRRHRDTRHGQLMQGPNTPRPIGAFIQTPRRDEQKPLVDLYSPIDDHTTGQPHATLGNPLANPRPETGNWPFAAGAAANMDATSGWATLKQFALFKALPTFVVVVAVVMTIHSATGWGTFGRSGDMTSVLPAVDPHLQSDSLPGGLGHDYADSEGLEGEGDEADEEDEGGFQTVVVTETKLMTITRTVSTTLTTTLTVTAQAKPTKRLQRGRGRR